MAEMPHAGPRLAGHVALVTGASSGLGLRFAKVLAAAGAKVALAARRLDRLEKVVEEIAADGGVAAAFELDVTNADQMIDVIERAEKRLGLVDILVNNAGVPDAQRAHKMSIDLIDRVIDINLRAPYILSCQVARRLIMERKPGRIINIASTAAFHYDGMGAALYSVTKAGVVRMSEALAMEWSAAGINVNTIAPGAFASEMMDGMLERVGDITQTFPRKRLGDPAQLDSTLLFLASDEAEAVTGTCVRVDDGQGPR